jgi:hypothetical protein
MITLGCATSPIAALTAVFAGAKVEILGQIHRRFPAKIAPGSYYLHRIFLGDLIVIRSSVHRNTQYQHFVP